MDGGAGGHGEAAQEEEDDSYLGEAEKEEERTCNKDHGNGDIDGDGGRLKAVADNEFVVAAKRDLEVGVAVLRSRHWAVSGMSLQRILAESISTQAACKIVALKAGCVVAYGEAMDASPLDVREALVNGCLRTLL